MKVLVIGSGGREHAIIWKLKQSPLITEILAMPGNGGTTLIQGVRNIEIPSATSDLTVAQRIAQRAAKEKVDFVIIGPERFLAEGLTDRLREFSIPVWAPTQIGALPETSKIFAHKLMMTKNRIPTAPARYFQKLGQEVEEYLSSCAFPCVVKVDGLADGKGVIVLRERRKAMKKIRCLLERYPQPFMIQDYIPGPHKNELSVFAFVDGGYVHPILVAGRDYKPLLNDDAGPNTGGMASVSSPNIWTPEDQDEIRYNIIVPTVQQAFLQEGIFYTGALFFGLKKTTAEVKPGEGRWKVVEYNCRWGDPETEAILPRFKGDFAEMQWNAAHGRLHHCNQFVFSNKACVAVVLVSKGYGVQEKPKTGFPITGLDLLDENILVFHNGTKVLEDGTLVTDGGRVLTIAALGDTIEEARQRVYENILRIHFKGMHYRSDIAA